MNVKAFPGTEIASLYTGVDRPLVLSPSWRCLATHLEHVYLSEVYIPLWRLAARHMCYIDVLKRGPVWTSYLITWAGTITAITLYYYYYLIKKFKSCWHYELAKCCNLITTMPHWLSSLLLHMTLYMYFLSWCMLL